MYLKDIDTIEVCAAIPIDQLDSNWQYASDSQTIIKANHFLEHINSLKTENEAKSHRLFIDNSPFDAYSQWISSQAPNLPLAAHSLIWDNDFVIEQSDIRMQEAKAIGTPKQVTEYLAYYAVNALDKVFRNPQTKSASLLNEILVLHGQEILPNENIIPLRGRGGGLIPDMESVAMLYKVAKLIYPEKEFVLNFANVLFNDYKGADRKREYVIKTLEVLAELMDDKNLPTIGLQAHWLMNVDEAIAQVDVNAIMDFVLEIREIGYKVEISEFDFMSDNLGKSLIFIGKFFSAFQKTEVERFCFWHFISARSGWFYNLFQDIYGSEVWNVALPGDIDYDTKEGPEGLSNNNLLYQGYLEGLQLLK